MRLSGSTDTGTKKKLMNGVRRSPRTHSIFCTKIFSPSGASTGRHIRITLTLRRHSPPRAESNGIDRRAELGAAARTARTGVGCLSVWRLSVPGKAPVHLLPVAGGGDAGVVQPAHTRSISQLRRRGLRHR